MPSRSGGSAQVRFDFGTWAIAKRGLAPLPLERRARRKAGARWALVQASLHLRGGLMTQRISGFLLSDAIFGFQQYKTAAGLSPRTGVSYEQHLRDWIRQIGDRDISTVTTRDITAFLAWLHNGYTPQRRNGTREPQSRKACTGYFSHPRRIGPKYRYLSLV